MFAQSRISPFSTQSMDQPPQDEIAPVEALLAEFISEEELGRSPRIGDYATRLPQGVARRQLLELHDSLRRVRVCLPQRIHERTLLDGRYRLVRLCGTGGFGQVWLARDERLDDRQVAVKIFEGVRLSGEHQAIFDRERRALSRIDHPFVVKILDVGSHSGTPFLVMERVPGSTLQDAISLRRQDSKLGPLPWRIALEWMLPWLEGLAAVHQAGMVHRDIKPANLMLRPDGKTVLLDFGIASPDFRNSTGWNLIGTLPYLPPERTEESSAPASVASDVYQAALVLYEILTLAPAFTGRSGVAEMLSRIRRGEIPNLRHIRRDIPPALGLVVQRALSISPKERHSSAGELLEDLLDVQAGLQPRHSGSSIGSRIRLRSRRVWAIRRVAARAVAWIGVGSLLAVGIRNLAVEIGPDGIHHRYVDGRFVVTVVSDQPGRLFGFVWSRSSLDQEIGRIPLVCEDGSAPWVEVAPGTQEVILRLPENWQFLPTMEARFRVRHGEEIEPQAAFHVALLSWLRAAPSTPVTGVPHQVAMGLAGDLPRGDSGQVAPSDLMGEGWIR